MISSTDRARSLKQGIFAGQSVLYWMIRDKRVEDNWALLEAQKIAVKNNVPLLVCFHYHGFYKDANIRHYKFLFDLLKYFANSNQHAPQILSAI